MTQEQIFMDFILVSSLLTLSWDWAFHLTFNPFHVTGLFLYPVKQGFSDVFKLV